MILCQMVNKMNKRDKSYALSMILCLQMNHREMKNIEIYDELIKLYKVISNSK